MYKIILSLVSLLSIPFLNNCIQDEIITIKVYTIKPSEENILTIRNNIEIIIPEGAVEKNHIVTLLKNDTVHPEIPIGFSRQSSVYEVKHENLIIVLKKNALIKIKLNDISKSLKYHIVREHKKGIEILETNAEDDYLVAEVEGFSSFYIIANDLNEVNNEENIVHQSPHFYIAKSNKTKPINIYDKIWSSTDNLTHIDNPEIIGNINPSEEFKVKVGIYTSQSRQIMTNSNVNGFVSSKEIELLTNYNDFNNISLVNQTNIIPANIFLEKTKNEKVKFNLPRKFNFYPIDLYYHDFYPIKEDNKRFISRNYQFNLSTANRNGSNFILIDLISNNYGEFIKSLRGGFALSLPNNLMIEKENIELNYYDNEGLFIDAQMLPVNYEDYLYILIKNISEALTPLDVDKLKKFMEAYGVGELEEIPSVFFSTDSDSSNQVGLYFGSFQSGAGIFGPDFAPNASKLQIAVPISNSIEDVNRVLKEESIKVMLGIFINGSGLGQSGRCVILNDFSEYCEIGNIMGELTINKALKEIFNDYDSENDELIWFHSKFIDQNILKGYLHNGEKYKSKIHELVVYDESNKLLVIESEPSEWRMNNHLYSFFLLTKCNETWRVTNSFSKEYYPVGLRDIEIKNLGDKFGLFISHGGDGQGYWGQYINVYITNKQSFKMVLDEQIGGDNYGASEYEDEKYKYSSDITTNRTKSKLSEIIIHTTGTKTNKNMDIIEVDEVKIFRYNGGKYLRIK